ncbi:MAG: hypothetical protein LUQ07_06895 [Methanospirillum sp.]|nr:hypothetical protein [Methanospirillum sp.]
MFADRMAHMHQSDATVVMTCRRTAGPGIVCPESSSADTIIRTIADVPAPAREAPLRGIRHEYL